MVVLFAAGLALCDFAEADVPPQLSHLHVSGGNMEGKEVRFGIGSSVLAAVVTSNGATGSYNSMHDSYQPLGVLVPLVNMLLGEVIFGGLGTGLYGMVMIALIAVFLGGLMIGRTPEYLGKKLTADETRLTISVRPPDAGGGIGLDRRGDGHESGTGGPDYERWDAGFYRSALRLRLVDGQQWPEHGRSKRQQPVLQLDHGHRHALRTIWLGCARLGAGRTICSPTTMADHPRNVAL